jgi:hypothetical protein
MAAETEPQDQGQPESPPADDSPPPVPIQEEPSWLGEEFKGGKPQGETADSEPGGETRESRHACDTRRRKTG